MFKDSTGEPIQSNQLYADSKSWDEILNFAVIPNPLPDGEGRVKIVYFSAAIGNRSEVEIHKSLSPSLYPVSISEGDMVVKTLRTKIGALESAMQFIQDNDPKSAS